jgi:hypothetical protein
MNMKPSIQQFNRVWVSLGLACVLLLSVASMSPAQTGSSENQAGGIWGKLVSLSNTSVVVDGNRYLYAHNVIIHTRAVTPDKRGNVKVTLDEKGRAIEVSLYGIEEPEAMTTYFRHDN